MESKPGTLVTQKSILQEVFQLNVQGINPKVEKQKIKLQVLSNLITGMSIKIPFFVCLETHLKDYIMDAEVAIPDYNIFRADRPVRRQGGVAIYSHHTFNLENMETFSNNYCDCALAYNKQNNLIIIAIYRPPDTPTKKFEECLQRIQKYKDAQDGANVIIFGDLNLKFIDWSTETLKQPEKIKQTCSHEEKNSSYVLLDFINDNLMFQMVNEYTRKDKSILDLVITSDEDIVFDVTVEKNNLDTDHDTVTCQLLLQPTICSEESEGVEESDKKSLDQLNFDKAEWTPIKEELSEVKWKELFTNDMSVENMSELLEEKIFTISEKHTPKRTQAEKKSTIPRNRLKLIRKRKRLKSSLNFEKYVKPIKSKQRQEELQKKIFDIEEAMKALVKEEIYIKEMKAIMMMRKNPKFFYSYVKKTQKTQSKVGPLQDEQGNLKAEPVIKANLLQDQYVKVFSKPENARPENEYNDRCDAEIRDIDISVADVKAAIKDIPTYSAPGPDKLPAVVLKECADEITEAIIMIWRRSLDTGEIPEMLKLQTIIPLFKKGSKSLPENYRPVSLTSHLIKLFERVLRKKIIKHIEDNLLLSNNQHAFRAGRSCLTQLLHHMDEVLKALENRRNVDVVYLDFAKAFDKVDHNILMKKVEQFGIKGKLHAWILSFISNRYQQVLVDGKLSRKEKVISGVPQGTVLGPLLFLIFINDLELTLKHSILHIFADDSKLVKEVVNEEDHQKLQEDLDTAMDWAVNNNMELNQKKFQLLQYGKEEVLKTPYHANTTTIDREQVVKDLGVQMSEDLSPQTHIAECVKLGRKYTGWIMRNFRSRKPEVIIPLFKMYVIPRMEYSSILWSPYKIAEINQLESVQRTITARVEGMRELNYHQRLYSMKLYSMMRRRERYMAIQMFKIATGLVPNNMNLEFYETRRHGLNCRKPKLKATMAHLSTVRLHYFTFRGPAIYNILPAHVKQAETLQQFKTRLDKYLKAIPDLPPTPGYPTLNKNSILEWATGNYDFAEIINTLVMPERGAAVDPDSS